MILACVNFERHNVTIENTIKRCSKQEKRKERHLWLKGSIKSVNKRSADLIVIIDHYNSINHVRASVPPLHNTSSHISNIVLKVKPVY